jgi:predicted nucleic acid-binding protein
MPTCGDGVRIVSNAPRRPSVRCRSTARPLAPTRSDLRRGGRRRPQGAQAVDLLIAATALAHDLPLYRRNGDDFGGLDALIDIHVV